MNVIGIDPAPGKPSTIFDGAEFRQLSAKEVRDYIRTLASGPDVLVCWDAPLTGPVRPGEFASESDFTTRPIEQFFSTTKRGWKPPKGISVRGYSGCPHWTLSRAVLGLPRLGEFDAALEQLPLRPIVERPSGPGAFVAEVHPAVALWLWCKDRWPAGLAWTYKRDDDAKSAEDSALARMLSLLSSGPHAGDFATCTSAPGWVPDDDHLDASVAWMLGRAWLDRRSVEMLGDSESGSFLLPFERKLHDDFTRFRPHPKRRAA